MKITDKKKRINAMPKGIWESSSPVKEHSKENEALTTTTDLQGNGYPTNKQDS